MIDCQNSNDLVDVISLLSNELVIHTKPLVYTLHIPPFHSNDLSLHVDLPNFPSGTAFLLTSTNYMTTRSKIGIYKPKLLAITLGPHGYLSKIMK